MLGVIIPARALPGRRQVPATPDGSLLISEMILEMERQSLGGAKEEGDVSPQKLLQIL